MKTSSWLGRAQLLLAGVAFGFLGLFGKMAFERGVSPVEFLTFRFLVGALTLGLVVLIRDRGSLRNFPRGEAFLRCVVLGVMGYALFSSLFFYTLTGASASVTVLLLFLYPVFVALGAALFLGERMRAVQWVSLPLSLLGLFLLVSGDLEIHRLLAVLTGLGSAFFYAAYVLASRKWLVEVEPMGAVVVIQASAGVALALLAFHGQPLSRWTEILRVAPGPVLGAAWLGSVLAMSLFLSGLKKVGSVDASLLTFTEPLTGVVLAALFLGERLGFTQWVGAVLVLSALVLGSLRSFCKQAAHG